MNKKSTPRKASPRAMPSPGMNESRSIDIRKIANGHIVRESGMDARGNYKSKETYTPTPPKIQIPPMPKPTMKAPMPRKGK